jgi:hypothetical protein
MFVPGRVREGKETFCFMSNQPQISKEDIKTGNSISNLRVGVNMELDEPEDFDWCSVLGLESTTAGPFDRGWIIVGFWYYTMVAWLGSRGRMKSEGISIFGEGLRWLALFMGEESARLWGLGFRCGCTKFHDWLLSEWTV